MPEIQSVSPVLCGGAFRPNVLFVNIANSLWQQVVEAVHVPVVDVTTASAGEAVEGVLRGTVSALMGLEGAGRPVAEEFRGLELGRGLVRDTNGVLRCFIATEVWQDTFQAYIDVARGMSSAREAVNDCVLLGALCV